ncbi:MBL fold metallo-hydrolase [Acidobacteria bacterium AH-259-D05]|nr:MBL fold metallo-hydrolase [Acidobacteria bacterium AH-259-D05]
MNITILGSGTSIPHPQRASPGLVIRVNKTTILVDPSSGTLHRAERYGTAVKNIDYALISHFHPDHTGDIGPLLFALRNAEYFGSKKLTLIGPPGLKDFHRGLLELYGSWIRLDPDRLTLQEIRDHELKFSGWSIRSLPVVHTDSSLGYRFTDSKGKVFTYSGDTDYCPELIELARDADAALIEAAQPSQLKVEGHLTPKLAGKVAQEAGVQQLIITHLYPICDHYDLLSEIRSSGYTGPAAIARDGMEITLS